MRKVIDVGTDGGVGAGGDGLGGGGFTLNGNAIVSAQYGSASLTPFTATMYIGLTWM
jgi:hypothetical protein